MELNDIGIQISTHLPFWTEFWPFIIAVHISILGVIVLFKVAVDNPLDDPLQAEQDLLDELDDLGGNEKRNHRDELTPALPEDLKHVPFHFTRISHNESKARSKEFYNLLEKRRSVRSFSTDPVPIEIIRNIIKSAGTAPSGVHTEPWVFIVVSNQEMKQQIREIVENEEKINYERRMGDVWVTDLKPLRTDWRKNYLTTAPYLIIVFKQAYGFRADGQRKIHYSNEISVAIASGILLNAIHYAGLVAVPSTPLNCGPALKAILGRPKNEKFTLLIPVGYPAPDATIPELSRKPLEDIMVEI